MSPATKRIAGGVMAYAALLALTGVFVIPLLWMVTTSFKTNPDATTLPLSILPREFSVEGYREVLTSTTEYPVHRWFLNSLIAATGHAALVLVVASLAAYPLARMSFRGKRIIFATIITTLFIPGFIFLVPNYLIVDSFGWLDTFWAIIVPGAAGAFGVFFLRQFFLAIPRELEEAALIDGANRLQIFLRIILPLSKPALATLALLSFLANWNDFLWPIYVLFSPEKRTLPPGLATLQGTYLTDYPVLMAGAMIAAVPVLILFLVTQKYIIEGVARTGLKG
ncbi:MAG TPA: carbohydrate ABC transporter permease [Actinopolymorphaceae bacterium]